MIYTTSLNNVKLPVPSVEEKHSQDHELKHKLRSVNLIKYNPNLFANREKGDFYQIIGGHRTALTMLTWAALFVAYRQRANSVNKTAFRLGVWNKNISFWAGMATGAVWSTLFFVNWQRLGNDYLAHFLFKRYPACKELNRSDIWAYRNTENNDEHYYFTSSFINNAHLH